MTRKVMLINATDPEEIRVATVVDGQLSDFDLEFIHNEKIKGNIYKARIVRVDSSLQAAFVHYGGQKNGFLPIGELPRDLVSPDGRRGRIQDLLQRDQEFMVQAVREEIGTKGAMLTAQISLPGRYLVLTPGNPINGISRKIESQEEREYFKELIDELEIPRNMGVIVRTASLGVTKEDFQRDLEYLLDTWKEVQGRYKHRQGPGLAWQEDDVVTRALRDGFSKDVEEVHIDDLDTYQRAQAFFKRTMPQHLGVLKHYVGKKPLFSRFQTEEQIDRIYARKVALPSGGALVLDQTEALVAIDVNSGKTSGEGVEDMAFKTNMEAAEEVARQLRLRDLAGLIVIDFIDMKRDSHNREVMEHLVECLREDKARMEVGKINRFGVLVMTRQRLRPSIEHVTHEDCPTCQGKGRVKNLDSLVLSVVRRLKAYLSRNGIAEIRLRLAPAIAMAVLNQKRRDLAELEEAHDARILIQSDPEMGYAEMAAEIERSEEEPAEAPARAPRGREREADGEDSTVVLGGDAPISFEKALAQGAQGSQGAVAKAAASSNAPTSPVHVRREAQRAALEERERLRALFESARPEDELLEAAEGAEDAPEGAGEASTEARAGRRRNRRGRGRGRNGEGASQQPGGMDPVAGTGAELPPQEPVALPVADATPAALKVAAPKKAEPKKTEAKKVVPKKAAPAEAAPLLPTLNGDLLAALAIPAPRPRLTPATPAEPAQEAPTAAGTKGKGRARATKAKASAEPASDEPVKAAKPRGKAAAKAAEAQAPLPVADPIPAKRSKAAPAPEAEAAPAKPKAARGRKKIAGGEA